MSKVLLINDSKFECIIIKDILFNLGFDVVIGDEDNALSLVISLTPEFVIVNYIMKKISGDQLISIIKAKNPNIKCILSSSNTINKEQFPHKKIDAVFHTPIDRQVLSSVIKSISIEKATVIEEMKVVKQDKVKNIDFEEPLEEKSKFCSNCGHILDKEKEFTFCPYCGHKI